MVRPQAWTLCTLALSLFALFSLAGCGEDKPQDTEPEYTAAEKAEFAKQARLDQLEERVTKVLENAKNNPDRWAELIEVMDAYLLEAGWYGSETAHLVSKLEVARKQVAERRENAANEGYAAVLAQVESDVAQEEYDRAAERLAEFDPNELFAETEVAAKVEAKRQEMLDYAEASLESSRVVREARAYYREENLDSVGRAVAILESFPDEFAETQFGVEIRELIDDYFGEYKKLYAEEQANLNVEPEDIVIEEFLGNFTVAPREGVWTVEGDELVGDNSTDGKAVLLFGDRTWRSFRVQFQMQAEEGMEFRIGATVRPAFRPGQQARPDSQPAEVASDGWIDVMITVRAGMVHMQDLTNRVDLVSRFETRGTEAGIFIGLSPGQEIRLRNIQAYVFERAGGDPDDDEDLDDDDDDGTGN